MLWDVTYTARDEGYPVTNLILQVEADTLTFARTEALPLVGTRGTIIRIDPATPVVPVADPNDRKVQGT